ncbi:MAG: hypothetical protein ACPG5B_13985 [Chitinophagales bacterium]
MLHIRFKGRSYDLQAGQIRLNINANDRTILECVANFLEVNISELKDSYVIDRRPNGNIIVRPEAVYG